MSGEAIDGVGSPRAQRDYAWIPVASEFQPWPVTGLG
jgi:hypothetical protein